MWICETLPCAQPLCIKLSKLYPSAFKHFEGADACGLLTSLLFLAWGYSCCADRQHSRPHPFPRVKQGE